MVFLSVDGGRRWSDAEHKENENMFGGVCVVTTTKFPGWSENGPLYNIDKIRGDIALETIDAASKRGINMVVVDGGSSQSFLQRILGNTIDLRLQEGGLGISASRVYGFTEAVKKTDTKVVVWMEPEKTDFLLRGLVSVLHIMRRRDVDVVIPKRSAKSLEKYPKYQQHTESIGNRLWNEILRSHGLLSPESEDFDVFFGPRAFRNKLDIVDVFSGRYDFLELSDEDMYSPVYDNLIFYSVMLSLNRGLAVKSVEVEYTPNKKQVDLEEANIDMAKKRDAQLEGIVKSAVSFANYLKKDSKRVLSNLK